MNTDFSYIYVLLFDDFTALDAFGPVEVLSRLPEKTIRYVSLHGGMVHNSQGICIETAPLDTMEKGQLLLLPGGIGTRILAFDREFLSALKKAADDARFVLSVCTGSALLAAAGLLRGRRATGNKIAWDWACSQGPDTCWQRKARWVVDGKFYTSAGVSAGTDMALGFLADQFGKDMAQEACRRMEYHWNSDPDTDIF
ncbi:MAG: DJ-1/PfpI family protein [Firmicutes bacterium]|nr:DJ-1/PfpI family protein [Bacillota bacterium]